MDKMYVQMQNNKIYSQIAKRQISSQLSLNLNNIPEDSSEISLPNNLQIHPILTKISPPLIQDNLPIT